MLYTIGGFEVIVAADDDDDDYDAVVNMVLVVALVLPSAIVVAVTGAVVVVANVYPQGYQSLLQFSYFFSKFCHKTDITIRPSFYVVSSPNTFELKAGPPRFNCSSVQGSINGIPKFGFQS